MLKHLLQNFKTFCGDAIIYVLTYQDVVDRSNIFKNFEISILKLIRSSYTRESTVNKEKREKLSDSVKIFGQ